MGEGAVECNDLYRMQRLITSVALHMLGRFNFHFSCKYSGLSDNLF